MCPLKSLLNKDIAIGSLISSTSNYYAVNLLLKKLMSRLVTTVNTAIWQKEKCALAVGLCGVFVMS